MMSSSDSCVWSSTSLLMKYLAERTFIFNCLLAGTAEWLCVLGFENKSHPKIHLESYRVMYNDSLASTR